MYKDRSESKIKEKWRTYITGVMTKKFVSFKKIDKYFRKNITESTSRAIEENWIRKLGIDYKIISLNINKSNEPLGISIEGRNIVNAECREIIQRHYLRFIMPHFCVGLTERFMVGDELLEVNGLMIYGMKSKDVVSSLKKLPSYMQIVVARSLHSNDGDISDHDELEGTNMPISFYDMDIDTSSRTSTLKSNSSLFSTTSRDFGSAASVGGLIDGQHDHVGEYLRDIVGWRGPIVIEFRKQHKESLGLALEEILDPITSELIIVFKIILPNMKVGKDGRIHAGDRLLQVNGKSVVGISFRKVCQWMKDAPGGRLILYICKPHFSTIYFENEDDLLNKYVCDNLEESDKLPKVGEETDVEILPVPEAKINIVIIKREDDKLGLFLDIVNNGKNGCRIKKVVKGLVKNNGVLHEGDYITEINDISLKIDQKNKLENCLRSISKKSKSDYKISYITKDDVEAHSFKYTSFTNDNTSSSQDTSPMKSFHPNPSSILPTGDVGAENVCNSYDQESYNKASFETFHITINNDGVTNLGLVILPSLNEHNRYVGITYIHKDSLADKCGLLKINDTILSVNGKSFEYVCPTDAGLYLKNLMQKEEQLLFKIKRLINADGDFESNKIDIDAVDNYCLILSDLPDMCHWSLTKTHFGYGLSVKKLNTDFGVVVNEVEVESPAYKAGNVKSDYRFVMINHQPVITCSVDVVIKMVKNSKHFISLIMERPKFQEFTVKIIKDNSNSLGLIVGGGIDTKYSMPIIENIIPKTTCKFSRPLQSDDFIKEVNDICMLNRDHEEIIKILKTLPSESYFKIWRKLPFLKRDILSSLESANFLEQYMECSKFYVTISKPINNIPSFGINFGDVLILDDNYQEVIRKYKIVLSIEKDSLFEKYAPEVKTFCYVIAINNTLIDVNLSCEGLKKKIDCESQLELILSRDIPYQYIMDTSHDDRLVDVIEDSLQVCNDNDSNSKEMSISEDNDTETHLVDKCKLYVSTLTPTSEVYDNDVSVVMENVYKCLTSNNISEIIINSKELNLIEKKDHDELSADSINLNLESSLIEDIKDQNCEQWVDKICPSIEIEFNHGAEIKHFDQPLCVDQNVIDQSFMNYCDVEPSDEYNSSEIDNYIKLCLLKEEDILKDDGSNTQENSLVVTVDNPSQPIINEYPLQPIINEDLLQPIINEDSSQPIINEDASQPIINEYLSQPITNEDPFQPIINEDLSQFIINEDPLQPIIHEDLSQPIINEYLSQFIINEDPSQPIIHEDPSQPIINEDPSQPIINEDLSQFIINKDPSQPIINEDLSQFIINEDPLQSIISKYSSQPIINDNISKPIINDDLSQSVLNDVPLQLMDDEKVKYSEGEKTINNDLTEMKTEFEKDNSIEEKDELNNDQHDIKDFIMENTILDENSKDNNLNMYHSQAISEIGIEINYIIVPKVTNKELGFHIFGGINGGPDKETLPIYVIGVEKNTCNWPLNQEEPFLSNGLQLLELNGCDLSILDSTTIERTIATMEGDLIFKVLQFK